MWRSLILLLVGVWACSTSVLFIKLSDSDPVFLAAWRQVLAALLLWPLFLKALRRHGVDFPLRRLRQTVPAGIFLGLHFVSWIYGARGTPAAHATLIVNMVPAVMPFILYFLLREPPNRSEIKGTVLALSGICWLAAGDLQMNAAYVLGDLICLVSMFLYALYLGQGRLHRGFPSLWLYVVPVYAVGGFFCLLVGLFLRGCGWIEEPVWTALKGEEFLFTLGLTVVPTVLGHTAINHALKHLRGQTVVILNLLQFVFASVMSYFLLAEIPVTSFYMAAGLVVAGAVLVVTSATGRPISGEEGS